MDRKHLKLISVFLLFVATVGMSNIVYESFASERAQEMPVFVINLAHRTDRKQNMEANLQISNVKFIPAVHGGTLDDILHYKLHNNKLTKGEAGCALSHLAIYAEMVKNNIDAAIVLEDDIDIKLPQKYDDIQQLINAIPDDWNIIYLGTNNSGIDAGNDVYQRLPHQVYGAHGYIIKKDLATQLLHYFYNNKLDEPFDFLLSNQDKFTTLKSYRPKSNIVNLVSGDSDTQGIR